MKVFIPLALLIAVPVKAQWPTKSQTEGWRPGETFRRSIAWYEIRLEAYKLVEEYRYWKINVPFEQIDLHDEFVGFVIGLAYGANKELWNIPPAVSSDKICRRVAAVGPSSGFNGAAEVVVYALATQWPTAEYSIKPSMDSRRLLTEGFGINFAEIIIEQVNSPFLRALNNNSSGTGAFWDFDKQIHPHDNEGKKRAKQQAEDERRREIIDADIISPTLRERWDRLNNKGLWAD